MRRSSITYGVTTQALELYAPESLFGAPSSITFSVWEGSVGDDEDVEFSGSGSVDATSTTLDGNAGAGQHAATGGRRRIPLTATTNIVAGRDYRIANAAGQAEIVRVVSISSGAHVEVEHDLAYDYASADTFVGLRMTAAVDDTFAATEAALNYPETPYRVLWAYSVAGVTYRHWTQFDLVRAAKKHGVTVDDLLGDHPHYLYQMGQEERLTGARRLLDAAWDRVQTDLILAGVDPNSMRDSGMLDMLVKEAALMTAGDRGEAPPGRDSEQWGRERSSIYKRDVEKAISGNKLLVDQGLDGGITAEPARAGWFSS